MISNSINLAKQANAAVAIQAAAGVAFANGQVSGCRADSRDLRVRVTGGRTSHVGTGSHRAATTRRTATAMRRGPWTYQAYFTPEWSSSPPAPESHQAFRPHAGKVAKTSKDAGDLREALALAAALPTRRSAPQSRLAA